MFNNCPVQKIIPVILKSSLIDGSVRIFSLSDSKEPFPGIVETAIIFKYMDPELLVFLNWASVDEHFILYLIIECFKVVKEFEGDFFFEFFSIFPIPGPYKLF